MLGSRQIETPLGLMRLEATGTGLCSAHFLRDDDPLESQASSVFDLPSPAAASTVFQSAHVLQSAQKALDEYFLGFGAALDTVPIDLPKGTPFQQSVWSMLRNVPHGKTVSYSELAASLNRPRAFRAVANACAANLISLFIPCHRLLASNGSLAGYRWGKDRKLALLNLEKQR